MQAVSGRPQPSAIMAVGQFFNPEKETKSLSAAWLLSSLYKQQVLSPPPAPAPLALSHFHWSIQTRQRICIYKYMQASFIEIKRQNLHCWIFNYVDVCWEVLNDIFPYPSWLNLAAFMVKGVPSNGVEYVSCSVLEYSSNDA